MTNDEYMQTQTQIAAIAAMVREMPLDAFIEAAVRAEAVGAVVDPTLYRAGAKKLDAIITMARALHRFQRAAREAEPVLADAALRKEVRRG